MYMYIYINYTILYYTAIQKNTFRVAVFVWQISNDNRNNHNCWSYKKRESSINCFKLDMNNQKFFRGFPNVPTFPTVSY